MGLASVSCILQLLQNIMYNKPLCGPSVISSFVHSSQVILDVVL